MSWLMWFVVVVSFTLTIAQEEENITSSSSITNTSAITTNPNTTTNNTTSGSTPTPTPTTSSTTTSSLSISSPFTLSPPTLNFVAPCTRNLPLVHDRNSALPTCRELPRSLLNCTCPNDTNGTDTSNNNNPIRPPTPSETPDGDKPVPFTSVCVPLPGVVCIGFPFEISYPAERVPEQCALYGGFHFASALLFSVFLGFCGIDRFYMGYCFLGIVKLLTLGGIGVWWAVDTALLISGVYAPADSFLWEPRW